MKVQLSYVLQKPRAKQSALSYDHTLTLKMLNLQANRVKWVYSIKEKMTTTLQMGFQSLVIHAGTRPKRTPKQVSNYNTKQQEFN